MPTVSVILPIGPGHEQMAEQAIESVTRASDKPGPFDDVFLAYIDDRKGEMGRSKARNTAAAKAKGDWLFFLDADDLLLDNAFEDVAEHLHHEAVWGLICELRPDGQLLYRQQVLELDNYNDNERGFLRHDPFLTCQMGHFVRRESFECFDESLDIGEDFDYYNRMWKNHDCVKIRKPFFVNRRGFSSTGPRSGTGRDWNKAVREMYEQARANAG